MRKSLLSLIFTGLLITMSPAAHADQWVAITYLVGTTTGEYSGLVDDATYSQITGKLDPDAMVKMTQVFWLDATGKVDWLINGGYGTVKSGYQNLVYFRENTITRVAPLDKDYITNLIKPAAK